MTEEKTKKATEAYEERKGKEGMKTKWREKFTMVGYLGGPYLFSLFEPFSMDSGHISWLSIDPGHISWRLSDVIGRFHSSMDSGQF